MLEELDHWLAPEEHAKVKLISREEKAITILYESTLIRLYGNAYDDGDKWRHRLDGILYGLSMLDLKGPACFVRKITYEEDGDENNASIYVHWDRYGFTKERMDCLDESFMEAFNRYALAHVSDDGEHLAEYGALC